MRETNDSLNQRKKLTENLAALRKQMDLSPVKLGEMAGVTWQQVTAYETGRRVISLPYYLAFVRIFEAREDTRKMLDDLGITEGRTVESRPAMGRLSALGGGVELSDEQLRSVSGGISPAAVDFQIEYANSAGASFSSYIREEMRRQGIPDSAANKLPSLSGSGRLRILWNSGDAEASYIKITK